MNEIAIALRRLRRAPSFTIPAVVVWTLGIGMAVALYAVVYAMWLRPLPYWRAGELVAVMTHFPAFHLDAMASADYGEWQGTRTLGPLGAYNVNRAALVGREETVEITRAAVSGNLLDILGVRVALGRGLEAGDDQVGAARVAVLSDGMWRERFGGARGAIGQTLNINGETFTIVGVLPRGFRTPEQGGVEVLTPLALDGRFLRHGASGSKIVRCVARLRGGARPAQAVAELEGRLKTSRAEDPQFYDQGVSVRVVPLERYAVGDLRAAGMVLAGAVLAILAIVNLNICNLWIARAAGRAREISIRVALGASKGQIARLLAVEGLAIGAIGIGGGLVLGWGLVDALARWRPAMLGGVGEVRLGGELLALAIPLLVVSALAFSLVPALRLPYTRLRRALVAGELALSFLLVVTAALLVNSLERLRSVAPGFQTEHVVTAAVGTGRANLRDELRVKLERLPGVTAVSFADALPPGEWTRTGPFRRADRKVADGGEAVLVRLVDEEFFGALGIPLVRGRGFSREDVAQDRMVAVVNQTLAKRYFAGEDALGKQVDGEPWKTIIGVAADTRNDGPRNAARPEIYVPYVNRMAGQGGGVTHANGLRVIVRTAGDADATERDVRRVLHDIDPRLLGKTQRLDVAWAELLNTPRFEATVLSAFAGLALVLAAAGVYGVLAHGVVLRRKELGTRLALGARPADIRALVLGEALRLGAIGVGSGAVGALLAGRVLKGLLFGLAAEDPATWAGCGALLLVVALGAGAVPAMRAAGENPADILRSE